MQTGARARLDSSVRRYSVRTCCKIGPVVALAAVILLTGFAPRAVAQDVVGYVANSVDNTVSLIVMDNGGNVVTGMKGASPQTVAVGTSPVRAAAAPNNGLVFVTNRGANSIAVIDPTTNTALPTTITIPAIGGGPAPRPQGIAVLENGTAITLYVANSGDNSVSIINATNIKTGTFTQIARLSTGIGPTPIEVVLQLDGNAYVLNNNQGGVGTVSTINTGTNAVVSQTIQVGHNATGLAASPDGTDIYVTNRDDNSVTAIDVGTLVQTQIAGVTDPVGVAFDPNPGSQNAAHRIAYVTNYSASSLTEIFDDVKCDATNANCLYQNPLVLPGGAHPSQVQVLNRDLESQIFISDPLAGNVLSFATFQGSKIATLAAGNVASGFAFMPFADSTEPATPVCGLTQDFGGGTSDQVEGICVGGGVAGTNPNLIFQTNQGLFCGGQAVGTPCTGNQGFVGGAQDYANVAPGVYTVIVCSDLNLVPPNCTGGVSAQQLVAWSGTSTPPSITCPQFTATKDAALGLTADASARCDDAMLALANETNPHVALSMNVKVDWGDGSFPFVATQTQATGTLIQVPPHQYAKAGTYNVILAAGDTTLLSAAPQTIAVNVTDVPPTCTLPIPSVNNFAVIAAPTCFDEFNKPVTQIVIDWGQGVPNSPTMLTGGQVNKPTQPFIYPTTTTQNPFKISVTGTATSPTGQLLTSAAVTQMVTVPSFAPQGPSCTISASATLFSAQAPVTCNATATGDVIQSVTVTWGDGTSSPAPAETTGMASFTQTFQHIYPAVSAKYTIGVIATDMAGIPGTLQTTSLTIVGPVPPRCSLTVQSTGGFGASATAQCVSDDTTLASVAVDFGDGTVVPGAAGSSNFGPQTFTHTYAAAGTYTITLTGTDNLQLVNTQKGSVTVPTLTVTGPSDATISAGGTATFTVSVPAGLTVLHPPLTLSCVPNPPQTTLPPGFVCLFSPANISPGKSSILTIATNSVPPPTTSALRFPSLYGLGLALLPGILLVGSGVRSRKTGVTRLVVVCLVMVLVLGLAGCGTNPPPVSSPTTSTSGTFTVQVQVADATQKVLGTSTVTVTIK